MIARLRERSPRGRIVRRGLGVSLVLVLCVFVGAASALVLARPGVPVALAFLPLLALIAVFLLEPRLRPGCPACGYRFRDAIQYSAMLASTDRQRFRYCPHCGLDLASKGDVS